MNENVYKMIKMGTSTKQQCRLLNILEVMLVPRTRLPPLCPDPVPPHTSFLDVDTVSSSVSDADWPRDERASVSISSSSAREEGGRQSPPGPLLATCS